MTVDSSVYDLMWVLSSGFLVLLMQAGFACLESGMVRAKNSINVAIKNLVDFCIAGGLYYLVGFGLMFGGSYWGLFGMEFLHPGGEDRPALLAFCFFQLLFCGTATTIVSGAVAERMRFGGYCISTVILSALIYPVTGHWAWGGALQGTPTGWLAQIGFVDFAGASVVHCVGGLMALAALLVIGPRVGRFGEGGRPIEGDNLPTATLGVFLLWVGWFGFNGGSTFEVSDRIPLVIVNTALGGLAGGIAGLLASWIWLRKPVVDRIINGVIAGLVAVTASANVLHPLAALAVGAIGSGICIAGMAWLVRLEIDDAIGAVPVHLGAGLWGTLAVALFAPVDSLGTGLDRWDQLHVQLIGVGAISVYAFTVSYIALSIVDLLVPLRVSVEAERIGLNISEHGSSTALLELINQMEVQAREENFSEPVRLDLGTEAGTIAGFYNQVIGKFSTLSERSRLSVEQLSELVNHDVLTGLYNRRACFEALNQAVARSRRTGQPGAVIYMDLDGFKDVNDAHGHEAGDVVLCEVANRFRKCLREIDVVARLGGDEFVCILENIEEPRFLERVAQKLIASVEQPVALPAGAVARLGVSVGIARFMEDDQEDLYSIVRRADAAMYEAKTDGKGCFRVSYINGLAPASCESITNDAPLAE